MDDTLLRDDFTISPRTVTTINKVRDQGVIFTFATGRMPSAVRPYAQQLQLDLPVITYHGALIQQVLSEKILFRKVIPVEAAREIVNDLLTIGLNPQIHLLERVFTRQRTEMTQAYERISSVTVESCDLLARLAQEKEGVDKILLVMEEKDLKAVTPNLRERFGSKVHITQSKPIFLEMIERSVNKGTALAAFAAKMGIRQEEVMAIGDSFNDLEMIQYAGVGVAVGNARPEVKALADIVTGTNQEDGVAQVLEQYILER